MLNKGQTFLILSRDDAAKIQDWSSDITGTYIEANKPIAVLSGHTKGAFPRYFTGLPDPDGGKHTQILQEIC